MGHGLLAEEEHSACRGGGCGDNGTEGSRAIIRKTQGKVVAARPHQL